MISPGAFFHFLKIFIFHIVRWVKGPKKVQNDKKVCPSHFISQEPYIIWLSFMVQMCKMIISPGAFSVLEFWSSKWSGGWKGKKWPKMKNISVSHALHFRNHISYDVHLWHTCMCKSIISLDIFFIFVQNFDFLESLRGGGGKKAKNGPKH